MALDENGKHQSCSIFCWQLRIWLDGSLYYGLPFSQGSIFFNFTSIDKLQISVPSPRNLQGIPHWKTTRVDTSITLVMSKGQTTWNYQQIWWKEEPIILYEVTYLWKKMELHSSLRCGWRVKSIILGWELEIWSPSEQTKLNCQGKGGG